MVENKRKLSLHKVVAGLGSFLPRTFVQQSVIFNLFPLMFYPRGEKSGKMWTTVDGDDEDTTMPVLWLQE